SVERDARLGTAVRPRAGDSDAGAVTSPQTKRAGPSDPPVFAGSAQSSVATAIDNHVIRRIARAGPDPGPIADALAPAVRTEPDVRTDHVPVGPPPLVSPPPVPGDDLVSIAVAVADGTNRTDILDCDADTCCRSTKGHRLGPIRHH